MQIYCDGEHGIPIHFPDDGAADGAIFTAHELRQEARKAGWTRIQGQDLCETCNPHFSAQMKRKGGAK
jgi:hypothetical protein